MGPLVGIGGDKDVVVIAERQPHIEFVVDREIRHIASAWVCRVADVHGELAVRRVETASRYSATSRDVVKFRPGIGHTRTDMEANKPLAGADELFHAIPFGL